MATKKKAAPKRNKAEWSKTPKSRGKETAVGRRKPVGAKSSSKKGNRRTSASRTTLSARKNGVRKRPKARRTKRAAAPTTRRLPIRALGGRVCDIELDEDCVQDPHQEDINGAIENFIALEPSALTDVEQDVFRYYLDCKDDFEPGDPQRVVIESPKDVWEHIQFGSTARVTRGRDGSVYLSLGCNCDWEQEHGLQIVFKEGRRVNKVGAFDGHVTNSSAYDDPSLENVIYRPRAAVRALHPG